MRLKDIRMQKETGWNTSIKLAKPISNQAKPQPKSHLSQAVKYLRQRTKTRPHRQIETQSIDNQLHQSYAMTKSVLVEPKRDSDMSNKSFTKASKRVVLTVQDEEPETQAEGQVPQPRILRASTKKFKFSPERRSKRLNLSVDMQTANKRKLFNKTQQQSSKRLSSNARASIEKEQGQA